MHQPPARTFLKTNFPSGPEVVVSTSGGLAKLLQSRRRSSIDALGTGSLVPVATTIPDTEAVPGGSCCCVGFGGAPGSDRGFWAERMSPGRTVKITAIKNRLN